MKTRSDNLAVLLAVVDSGSFSRAAEQLDVQVATVSKAVSRIEAELGTTLLARTTRRLELTEEGRHFVQRVRQGLKLLEEAEEELDASQGKPRGRLRVDAASPFVLHQIVPFVSAFRAEFPAIELELTSSDGIIDLLERRTDLAIRIGGLSDSSLHARALGQSPLHMVASPAYLAKRGVPLHPLELGQHQLLGFVSPASLNRWPLPGKPQVEPAIRVSSGETLRQLALSGNGIACLSNFMVAADLSAGSLVKVLVQHQVDQPERQSVNAVYYRNSGLSKRIQAFLDFYQPRFSL